MDLVIGVAVLLAVVWLLRRGRKQRSFHTPTIQPPTGPHLQEAVQPPQTGNARWVNPGEHVVVGGTRISGGLFYLGSRLTARGGYYCDNALINPSLRIATSPGNTSGEGVPYYPSYSNLDPQSRRALIDWLAGPRNDPSAYIGYVFIYFYGLERRLFLDQALSETKTIVGEVKRLLSVYGGSNSFAYYASNLLDAAIALSSEWPRHPVLDPDKKYKEMPIGLRGALGNLLNDGKSITADWALAWYLASPNYALRTPAKRCFSEFLTLFRERFAVAFPNGLSLSPPRRRLSASYRAASGSFTVELAGAYKALPDIVALLGPLKKIEQVVSDCTGALEAYSRMIGREPGARAALRAQLLLPDELLQHPAAPGAITALKKQLGNLVPQTAASVSFTRLEQLLEISRPAEDKITRSEAATIAHALERLGFAIEPDPRYGGPLPRADANVMVFRITHAQSQLALSQQFVAARSQVEIAVLIAGAEQKIGDEEARALIRTIRSIPDLSDFERARLIAYLGYLVCTPPDQHVLSKLKEKPLKERTLVAQAAITSTTADGHLRVEQVKLLERTYKALGLPSEDLYHDLNAVSGKATASDEPTTIIPAKPARGIPIPPSEPDARVRRTPLRLDKNEIERIQAETVAVQRILGDVFDASDPHQIDAPENTRAQDEHPRTSEQPSDLTDYPGLEQRHASLLAEICTQDVIDHATFARLAHKHGLYPSGAIETINEWAFARFEEPLLDDGDPIEIAHHLIRIPQIAFTNEQHA
jgi:tellurite resistance protein